MYSVSFIFDPGEYDEEFHELDSEIAEFAESLDGFAGKEVWMSPDGRKVNSIYYWRTEEALLVFSKHPTHVQAKKKYQRWYNGYHLIISKVERSYGDGAFEHITPNTRMK